MYAVVRSGGRQHKVTVGDVSRSTASTRRLAHRWRCAAAAGGRHLGDLGGSALASASVTAEVLAETKGPKIRIMKFKNKTGYRKRQGHRQKHTQIRITGIES